MSRSSEERELYDVSSTIKRAEGSNSFNYAGPPADTQLPYSSYKEYSHPQSKLVIRR